MKAVSATFNHVMWMQLLLTIKYEDKVDSFIYQITSADREFRFCDG